jgi:hypothetical protein
MSHLLIYEHRVFTAIWKTRKCYENAQLQPPFKCHKTLKYTRPEEQVISAVTSLTAVMVSLCHYMVMPGCYVPMDQKSFSPSLSHLDIF